MVFSPTVAARTCLVSFGRRLSFYGQFAAGGLTNLDAYRNQELRANSIGVLVPTPVGQAGIVVSFNENGEPRFRLSLGSFWNRP